MFPDECGLTTPKHFDPVYGINSFWSSTRKNICWEFIVIFFVYLIVLFLLEPPCYRVWIIMVGVYLVFSVLTMMIDIVTFGVLFSLLYLLDMSLGTNLDKGDRREYEN